MTQTGPGAPYTGYTGPGPGATPGPGTGPTREYREEFPVTGEQLAGAVEKLLHEGNVRRIIIKQEGRTVLEIPLTIGVIGALIAPVVAAAAAVGAILSNCTIEVVRVGPVEQPGEEPRPGAGPLISVLGGQSYSISHSGMQLFERGKIDTFMGGTLVDLVSAPIEPGEYRLEIAVTMGGVEIFLPHCVHFTLEGNAIAGGRNVHEGPAVWETMKQKLHHIVALPAQPPDFATAPPNPERPVHIHFVTNIALGGVDIYRL